MLACESMNLKVSQNPEEVVGADVTLKPPRFLVLPEYWRPWPEYLDPLKHYRKVHEHGDYSVYEPGAASHEAPAPHVSPQPMHTPSQQ